MTRVLFVCLGNICRSPAAEGILRARGLPDLVIDSAGTGDWHVGKAPDRRMQAACLSRNIDISDLRARQFSVTDFDRFDLIVAMDRSNYRDILALAQGTDKVALLSEFAHKQGAQVPEDVPDPYYGGDEGFETCLDIITVGIDGLVSDLQARI